MPLLPCAVPVECGTAGAIGDLRDGVTGVAPTGEGGARSRRDCKVTKSARLEKATMMK